jgi:hypothetical protein
VATSTAYDAAIALATAPEKERLRDLRLRLNIPPDSPEWGFYAVLAPLMASVPNEAERAEAAAKLDRIEQRCDDRAKEEAAAPAIPVEITTQLGRLETKVDGLKTAGATFTFARDVGCFLGGLGFVLAIQYFVAAQHVQGDSWLVFRCVAAGAALVVLLLVGAVQLERVVEERRLRR